MTSSSTNSSRYQIIKELGRGGMGAVHQAWDNTLKRYVAIKTLLADADTSADLLKEAAMMAALHHPNLIGVYDAEWNQDGTGVRIIMEFLDGLTLEQLKERKGKFSYEEFAPIAQQTLEGLIAAHNSGFLHRDIKPSNLMTTHLSDGSTQVKILDLGLAKHAFKPTRQTVRQDGTVHGSIFFMAPEQFDNAPMDVRSDLYSLGCVFYWALTGAYPHGGTTMMEVMNSHLSKSPRPLNQVRPDLPGSFCLWVHWLMERDMQMRPSDAREALITLNRVIANEPFQIRRNKKGVREDTATIQARERKRAQQMEWLLRWSLRAIGALGLIGIGAIIYLFSGDKSGGKYVSNGSSSGDFLSSSSSKGVISTGSNNVVDAGTSAPPPPTSPPSTGSSTSGVNAGGESLSSLTATETPPMLPSSLSKGLVVWHDGGLKVFSAQNLTVAPGQTVYSWGDRADSAYGDNISHPDSNQALSQIDRLPKWFQHSNNHGLWGTHSVVSFDGNDSFVLSRGPWNRGQALEDSMDGPEVTAVVFLRTTQTGRTQRLISAMVPGQRRTWELILAPTGRGLAVCGGLHDRDATGFESSVLVGQPNQFFVAALQWSTKKKARQVWTANLGGTMDAAPPVSIQPLEDEVSLVRIGGKGLIINDASADYFAGEIAELLLFNRWITPEEAQALVGYFSDRYSR